MATDKPGVAPADARTAAPPQRARGPRAGGVDELERLRVQRILTDWVTGLPLYPLADLRNERVANLGVVYLQLGRFSGVEAIYGWELYDQVLRCVTESLQEDVAASPLRGGLLSLQFTGCDGFYLLFDLPDGGDEVAARLGQEADRLRAGAVRRLGQKLGKTLVELLSVHTSAVVAPDDPRTRPSRNLVRAMREAARLVESRESAERLKLVASCRSLLADRRLHAVYQPVVALQEQGVLGYEALIRGPAGADLELPDVLFAVAREADMTLELENLCLETIFSRVPRAMAGKKLFVNASPRLLAHSVFLDERNLLAMSKAHPAIVMEVSEKEVVEDYHAFRGTLDRLRGAGLQVAIDDAGSGYSGLEAILQLRPEYIKVATSIVRNLHEEPIKRQVISALATLGQEIGAHLIAEGIETSQELDQLRALGVPLGQGYLLGRPQARVSATAH
ncbi:MAG TPA: EAL domain-containing protein [Vicinamibacteria bacterium]|nr:EAL domain-containing protein [Vicinamibacteria bacterium]